MNKKNKTRAKLFILALYLFTCTLSAHGQFYECTFENINDSTGWRFLSIGNGSTTGSKATKWKIGSATFKSGTKSLYVSHNNGVSPEYNFGNYYITAHKSFTLPAGKYDLSFDWKAFGGYNNNGEPLDAFAVAWVPASQASSINAGFSGSAFPGFILNNIFSTNKGTSIFLGSSAWQNVLGTLTVPSGGGTYHLVFVWKVNSSKASNPGACIDNIQIAKQGEPTSCFTKPSNIDAVKSAGNMIVSWQGNAPQYELQYYKYAESTIHTSTIFTNNFIAPLNTFSEGIYTFKVRSICAGDTSVWIEKTNVLVYDPAAHCLDYLNFNASGVVATVGTFLNPYLSTAYVDNEYQSKTSTHTMHFIPGETDPLTGGALKTVPDGEIASVRLSNWTERDAMSGSVSYTYKIPSDIGVVLLKYAAVLQYASHHPASEQTKIIVEIMDSANNLLSPCTSANFNAIDEVNSPTSTWNVFNPPTGLTEFNLPLVWKDWTTVGINVRDYVGKTIKIRVTIYACSANYHFAYAYFTLGCGSGKIQGLSCGVKPDKFTVDEGFNYKWYHKYDPAKKEVNPIPNSNSFTLPSASDTLTYCVDMIYPENANCYFTLEASALARLPKARPKAVCKPLNCQNIVTFENLSGIFGYYADPNNPGQMLEKNTGEKCESYYWDFGKYGTSTEEIPTSIIIPNEGDSLHVSLRVTMSNESCIDETSFSIYIPPLMPQTDVSYQWIARDCKNEVTFQNNSVVYGSQTNNEGDIEPVLLTGNCLKYEWDLGVLGTSSEKTPAIQFPDSGGNFDIYFKCYIDGSNLMSDTTFSISLPRLGETSGESNQYLCEGESMFFNGKTYDKPGFYIDTLTSVYGCDSVLSLKLAVLYTETINSDTTICDDSSVEFFGQTLSTPGTYYHHVPSALIDCDSIVYVLTLNIREVLNVEIKELDKEICGDNTSFRLSYEITHGGSSGYQLDFDTEASTAEFRNIVHLQDMSLIDDIIVPIPSSVRPGNYNADITFFNSGCGNVSIPVDFTVHYPSSIIAQRWNDLLFVKNADYNGGYTFSSYQWYKNTDKIDGATKSYLYLPEGLDFEGAEYRIELTRSDDEVTISTCPFLPQLVESAELKLISNLSINGTALELKSSKKGIAKIYSVSGLLISTQTINEGSTYLTPPLEKGLYLLEVKLEQDYVKVFTIQVQSN